MSVKIGVNTIVDKKTILKGDVIIGDNCNIGPYCVVENTSIGNGVSIIQSNISNSFIGDDCQIGPFAHIRNNSRIGKRCRVGNFVEIKKSTLGDDVKCAHLSYIGDSSIGDRTNIGCGVITANYDGKEKHHTKIGKDCFIGCNSVLIAPIEIEDNSFIAASTTLTKSIEKETFAISRSELVIKKRKK